ncbi:DNA double-strand break repair nuclease NurA [Fervidicoccus fontis]|uniref:DNA double-strand break repair nuclease NurA n=1 Tax=Fervidicoccus fontis TaxID=683846 RepID=A0A7C2VI62_9CREN|nr:DNA double-strand break repair nuclease NurA [Fervidicoccus fontis]PMB76390.1 MAG: hypothetical protein C0177_06380 [Fervidicoccus fontis]HEW64125.1 DNA double-strand break repair nuclease NurA [Fervidicoccus fontis]
MAFHEDLFEAAIRKRDLIISKLKKFIDMYDKDIIKQFNEVQDFSNTKREDLYRPTKIAGIDGGSLPKSFLGFDLYFIKTYAIRLHLNEEKNEYVRGSTYKIADIDMLIPPGSLQDRITVYRQVTELRAILDSLKNNYFTLEDGSAESLISRPTHIRPRILNGLSEYSCEDIGKIVNKSFNDEFTSMGIKSLIEEIYEKEKKSDLNELAFKLELGEKFYYISEILKEITKGKELFFVTKTGRSNDFFNSSLSDQYIISMKTKVAGFITRSPLPLSKVVEESKTSFCGVSDLMDEVYLLTGYARLENFGPVLKVELLLPKFKAESISDPNKFYYEKLLQISSISVSGYPYVLSLAHQEAHIYLKTVEVIVDALGLGEEPTGREEIEIL